MLVQAEHSIGKIWADTDDPIIFLTPQPLKSNGVIKELFAMVYEMGQSIRKKNTKRIFLMLNLKESNGSNPELLVQLPPQPTSFANGRIAYSHFRSSFRRQSNDGYC